MLVVAIKENTKQNREEVQRLSSLRGMSDARKASGGVTSNGQSSDKRFPAESCFAWRASPKMHVMHAVRDMLLRAVLSHTFAGRTNAGETLLAQK